VSTKRINELRGTPGATVWQRNYYEHIIRDEEELNRVRQYIADNPARWQQDPENPAPWPRLESLGGQPEGWTSRRDSGKLFD